MNQPPQGINPSITLGMGQSIEQRHGLGVAPAIHHGQSLSKPQARIAGRDRREHLGGLSKLVFRQQTQTPNTVGKLPLHRRRRAAGRLSGPGLGQLIELTGLGALGGRPPGLEGKAAASCSPT